MTIARERRSNIARAGEIITESLPKSFGGYGIVPVFQKRICGAPGV